MLSGRGSMIQKERYRCKEYGKISGKTIIADIISYDR